MADKVDHAARRDFLRGVEQPIFAATPVREKWRHELIMARAGIATETAESAMAFAERVLKAHEQLSSVGYETPFGTVELIARDSASLSWIVDQLRKVGG